VGWRTLIYAGAGSRTLLKKPQVLDWVRAQAASVEHLVSVCTGALVLAEAGVEAETWVTHHDNVGELAAILAAKSAAPPPILHDTRYVDHGKVLMSGGISAGIDVSLYVVRNLLGDAALRATLTEMEYPWTPATDLAWKTALEDLPPSEG